MKKPIMLSILLISILGWPGCQTDKTEQANTNKLNLAGFWTLSANEFTDGSSSFVCVDPELLAVSEPEALGSHVLIEGDSISFFRYPYAYYGTFPYQLSGDSLWIQAGRRGAVRFDVQQSDANTLELNFRENITGTCLLSAKAKYVSMNPDPAIIRKLRRDSVAFDSLVGKWWHLRKEISYDDGSEPTLLNFPKGMPDSIFLSAQQINIHSGHPYLELKLNNRMVKLFIQHPDQHSFTLKPEFKKDEMLFSNIVDYGPGERRDTIYHEVIYRSKD